MKKRVLAILLLIVGTTWCWSFPAHRHIHHGNPGNILRDADVDFEDGSLIIHSRNDREVVEINSSYELFINHDQISLNAGQRNLTEKYYHSMQDLLDEACKIGMQGAEIGLEGAKIGLKAVAGVFRLILTEFDEEDLERELEKEEESIERKAERLEERAEDLEEMADELKDLHREMRRSIPELRELDWF